MREPDLRTELVRYAFAAAGLLMGCASVIAADPYVLDDPASPVRIEFHLNGGRLAAIEKQSGWTWTNPSSGGKPLIVSAVKQEGPLRRDAAATTSTGYPFSLSVELDSPSGELVLALSGGDAAIPNGIYYPDPLFAADGNGFLVFPTHGGYVVPTTELPLRSRLNAYSDSQMEWFGGTDDGNERAWIAVVESPDDWSLNVSTGNVAGRQVFGPVRRWHGSNGNPARSPSLLPYSRRLRYRFFPSGGYVAMAKHFRRHAAEIGWFRSLTDKLTENPVLERIPGAPVIYMWGDGRATELPREMEAEGIDHDRRIGIVIIPAAVLLALLRGQAPVLNLVHRGERGAARRTPGTVTGAQGAVWTSRWSMVRDRIKKTHGTVCRWQEMVGLLGVIDHGWLTADRAVQRSEFSADGGASGYGIVVHFGAYDGSYGLAGEVWEGNPRAARSPLRRAS
jgi:hypothetical protein